MRRLELYNFPDTPNSTGPHAYPSIGSNTLSNTSAEPHNGQNVTATYVVSSPSPKTSFTISCRFKILYEYRFFSSQIWTSIHSDDEDKYPFESSPILTKFGVSILGIPSFPGPPSNTRSRSILVLSVLVESHHLLNCCVYQDPVSFGAIESPNSTSSAEDPLDNDPGDTEDPHHARKNTHIQENKKAIVFIKWFI